MSLGATRWEATREIIQRSVRVAMTPVLNQMNVVGIVSIPGMMTGQILGGTDPSQVWPTGTPAGPLLRLHRHTDRTRRCKFILTS